MKRCAVFVAVVFAALFLPGCIIIPITGFSPELREVTLRPGGWFAPRVLMIDVDGAISMSGGGGLFGSTNTVAEIDEQLKLVEKDSSIKSVVLKVNSPGGGVTASDILYRRISKFREKSKKPVYVSMTDIGASGAYYISMAANKVYACPTTITGSIGVIAIFPEGESLLNKIGVQFAVVKSGQFKDMGSLFRHMKPEEQEILQKLVTSMYDRFVEVVSKGRPNLATDKIKELADGRVYTAQQAYSDGLIDGLAYPDEVIDKAEEAAGISHAKVIAYRRFGTGAASIYAQASAGEANARGSWLQNLAKPAPTSTNVNLINLGGDPTRGYDSYFQYLWIP